MYKRNNANYEKVDVEGENNRLETDSSYVYSEQEKADSSVNFNQDGDISPLQTAENNILLLRDVDTGIEYYMDIIDNFVYEGKTFTAMSPFSIDNTVAKKSEELILMQFVIDQTSPLGYKYVSISNPKELDKVFNVFFKRYEQATIN